MPNTICPECKSVIHIYGELISEELVIIHCLNCNWKSDVTKREKQSYKTLKTLKDIWR